MLQCTTENFLIVELLFEEVSELKIEIVVYLSIYLPLFQPMVVEPCVPFMIWNNVGRKRGKEEALEVDRRIYKKKKEVETWKVREDWRSESFQLEW